jgi:hypothetical protein
VKLVHAADRPAFSVHMDVCKGINAPVRFSQNAAFIRECLRLGERIGLSFA